MSIGTIVILVVLIILVILVLFFLRTSYCKDSKLSLKSSSKINSEIEDLFQSQGGEVKCLGSGTSPVELVSGKTNYIWCGFKSPNGGSYGIVRKQVTTNPNMETNSWFLDPGSWNGLVSFEDTEPKKVFALNIPKDVKNVTMRMNLDVYYPGINQPKIEILDFVINKINWFENLVC